LTSSGKPGLRKIRRVRGILPDWEGPVNKITHLFWVGGMLASHSRLIQKRQYDQFPASPLGPSPLGLGSSGGAVFQGFRGKILKEFIPIFISSLIWLIVLSYVSESKTPKGFEGIRGYLHLITDIRHLLKELSFESYFKPWDGSFNVHFCSKFSL